MALIHHDEGRSLQRVLGDCEAAGYRVAWRLYTTVEFGLPQLRSRVYFLGIRVDDGFMPKLPRPPGLAPQPLSAFLEDVKGPKNATPCQKKMGGPARRLRRCLKKLRKRDVDPSKQTWAIDIDSGTFRTSAPPSELEQ